MAWAAEVDEEDEGFAAEVDEEVEGFASEVERGWFGSLAIAEVDGRDGVVDASVEGAAAEAVVFEGHDVDAVCAAVMGVVEWGADAVADFVGLLSHPRSSPSSIQS